MVASTRTPSSQSARPAYAIAAVALTFAVLISVWNVALLGQLRRETAAQTRAETQSRALAQTLLDSRAMLSDLLAADAKHYPVRGGEVVVRADRIFVAMNGLPQPPRGHVYQVWSLPRGSKTMLPSPTFVPDARGVAVVVLAADARTTASVAVTVEPEGGSKHPTAAPTFVVSLS